MFNNLSIFNMAEEKTCVFGEGAGNNGILSLLGPMLSIVKRFLCDDCRQKLVIEIKEIDKKD
jgi:hypothetical protein